MQIVNQNNRGGRAPDKVCPLSWTPVQAEIKGLVQQPGLQMVSGTCVRERCGFWSESGQACGVASLAGELRRLRHTVLGAYDAGRQVLPHEAPDPNELESIGRAQAGDQDEDHGRGETPGEPG